MKLMTAFGVSTTLALAMSISASAQQSTQTSQTNRFETKETTLTGCVTPNKSGGFFLTQATMSPAGSASTPGTSPTGTTDRTATTDRTGTTDRNGTPNTGASAPGSTTSTTRPGGTTSATAPGGTTSSQSASTSQMYSNTYNLENGRDMQQYVNKKVEVIGHVENSTSGDKVKGTSDKNAEVQARDFEVKSIKAIGTSC